MHHVARFVLVRKLLPRVWLEVFNGERQTTIVAVNTRDDGVNLLTFLQHLARMLDPTRPRNIRNVDQSVNSVFNLDEGAKIGQVADAAMDSRTDLITLVQRLPRDLLHLFHAETDTSCARVDTKHFNLYAVARVDYLARRLDAQAPTHFCTVDRTVHAVLDFGPRSILRNAGNLSVHAHADRESLFDSGPR